MFCKNCGKELLDDAKFCPNCGAKIFEDSENKAFESPKKENTSAKKKPIYKRVWFWLLIVFFGIPVLTQVFIPDTPKNVESTESDFENSHVEDNSSSVFAGSCGISASAQMGSSIIGTPEMQISIKNISGKDISAIRFYAVPYDVYGEEIVGWMRQSNLYTDTTIKAGKSTTISYQFIENRMKTVKLYVYSVYFADGSEWGNKDSSKSEIIKNGKLIKVSGES